LQKKYNIHREVRQSTVRKRGGRGNHRHAGQKVKRSLIKRPAAYLRSYLFLVVLQKMLPVFWGISLLYAACVYG
jgi:hypothetical protein